LIDYLMKRIIINTAGVSIGTGASHPNDLQELTARAVASRSITASSTADGHHARRQLSRSAGEA